MLLRFAATNYASIRERQELSLVASAALKDDEKMGGVVRRPGFKTDVLTAAGVYGANASGKTRLLCALRAMSRAVTDSHQKWDPKGGIPGQVRNPFALHPTTRRRPTRFEADLLAAGIRYSYSFAVDDEKVVDEELWSFPEGRRRLLFQRRLGAAIRFGRGFPRGRLLTKFLRPNSLLVSTAAQNNVPNARAVYERFASVRFVREQNDESRFAYVTSRVGESQRSSNILLDFLRAADLGVVGIMKEVRPLSPAVREEVARKALQHVLREATSIRLPNAEARLRLLHQSPSGKPIPLRLDDESSGTKMVIGLAFPVFEALENGGLLLVDELDRSFHPLLAERLLDLFLTRNPRGAQIVFSTHAVMLLDQLRRDAIWFTEKQGDGSTRLFPLTDFHPRKEESVFRRYLQGRYGAVPSTQPLTKRGHNGPA